MKGFFQSFWSAFPDAHFTFESEVAEGDSVAGRGCLTGTHRGEFQGLAPTGKEITVVFLDQWRFEDGKVAEYWGLFDVASMMQQLGAMPPPTAG